MNPRVTFVTGSRVVWGAEMSLLTIAKNLQMDSELLTSNVDLAGQWLDAVGTRARIVRASPGKVSRLVGFLPAIARTLSRADVLVVFDYYLLPVLVVLWPLARARGVFIVVDVHDSAARNPKRRFYFWLMGICDRAIAVSDYIASQINYVSDKRTIYRPVVSPVSEQVRRGDLDGSALITVGIVGQVSPDKRVAEALEAIAEMGATVRVVLRGSSAAEHAGYRRRVTLLGQQLFGDRFVDEGRVSTAETMSGLDILLLTNPDEPFGRVVAEAQLAGVLVVGPRLGGIGEIIGANDTGFAFDDTAGIGTTLRGALSEVAKPTGRSESARRSARAQFDPSARSMEYRDALIPS